MFQTIENLGSFAMIIAVFIIFSQIIKSTFNFILKRKLIELGQVNEVSIELLSKPGEAKLQNLKWGLLFFFGGLGLIVIQFLPFSSEVSPLPYGVEAVFLAFGFFVYYLVARKQQ